MKKKQREADAPASLLSPPTKNAGFWRSWRNNCEAEKSAQTARNRTFTVAFSMRSGEVRADAVDLKTAHKQVVRVARVDTSEDEAQEAVRRLGVRDRPRSARSQRIERRIIDVSAQRDPIGVVGRTLQLPIARVVAGVVAARAKRVVGRANRVGCAKIELQAKSVTETRD